MRRLRKLVELEKTHSWSRWDTPIQNHTIPYTIKEIRPRMKQCELECGRQVSNQHIEYSRRPGLGDWLVKCVSCGLYKDPSTGQMVDHRVLQTIFRDIKQKIHLQDK